MKTILLIDTSEETFRQVKEALGLSFEVLLAKSSTEAQRTLSYKQVDLILSEVSIPGEDGFRTCAILKNRNDTKEIPFLFYTNKSNTADKVMGFTVGGTDYIVKPCAPEELKARVDSRIPRKSKTETEQQVVEVGNLKFNLAIQKVSIDNQTIKLTPIEFKLLYHLATHKSHVLSRNQLLTAVWGENVAVFDRTIDSHISSLRRKLSSFSYCIETIHGVGYSFSLLESAAKAA